MKNRVTEPELLDALAGGVLVVLPNRRAARTLREAYDFRQRVAGRRAWNAAPVLAWTDWTRSLWSDVAVRGHEFRLLLNAAQEHILWREIIETSTAGRTLSSLDALAEMASSAWSLAAAHNATARIHATATTFDTRTFSGWADSFRKICARENCISFAELEDALSTHVASGALRLDPAVLLAGFDELTPSQARVLESFRLRGAQIEQRSIEWSRSPELSRVNTIVPTLRDEIVFAARWIRQLFADPAAESAAPRVAVLLPNPHEGRAELESVFREILAPELQPIEADTSSAPWEFAGGTPLPALPMIVDALAFLRLQQGPLSIERLGALLRSPFFGSDSERLTAARFDAQVLRREPYLLPELDLDGLTRLIRQQSRSNRGPGFQPAWLNAVNDLRAARLRAPGSRSYAEWAELIRDLLRAADWPGDRAPAASEFATERAWDATLDLLSTLDFRGLRVSFAVALNTLEQLLRSARVSAPAANAQIQIMSPEETEGSIFDAVVLLHATDDAWPEPVRMHPLLGWSLQQDLRLPGADASRDADRALTRAESILRRTPNLLALSAAADDRGSLRPSPLIHRLGIAFAPPESILQARAVPEPIREETLPDDVSLPPLPSPELRGGASVLKFQAACGFLAFAEMRLQSAPVDPCELGLDAIERGNLVHRALENFWSVTQSQAELRALSTEERQRRLGEAIDTAFSKLGEPAPGWGSAYIHVQRERLRRLLLRWLDTELQRGAFTVRQREQRTPIPIGPLQLKVQPDRVDEVEGGIVLVDYKTGVSVRPANWDGDRPDDPQLPLYALLTEPGKLQAMLFGRVRPGSEMKWQGLMANQTILPKARQRFVDLDVRRGEWQSVLTTLAENFAAGRADVDPKSFTVNCDGCRQRLLCRVDPVVLGIAADEGDTEEEFDV
jgi:ATP-dependent helicase/nuclease subunit B